MNNCNTAWYYITDHIRTILASTECMTRMHVLGLPSPVPEPGFEGLRSHQSDIAIKRVDFYKGTKRSSTSINQLLTYIRCT
jgi:hypothetical protein